jgi:hypothetical protein
MIIFVAIIFWFGLGADAAMKSTQPPSQIYVFDITWVTGLTPVQQYEVMHFVSALQGLLNRDAPTLYLHSGDQDDFWLRQMSVRWLNDTKRVTIPHLSALVETFLPRFSKVLLFASFYCFLPFFSVFSLFSWTLSCLDSQG